MPNKDYYEILEVSKTATLKEIKIAYRRLSLIWHPDKNNNSVESKEKFQEIGEAYGVLSNENLRKRYDAGEINPDDFDQRQDYYYEAQEEKLDGWLRSIIIKEINTAFRFSHPFVREKDLNPNLWHPYENWAEKVRNMPITKGNKQEIIKFSKILTIKKAKN